MTKLRLAAAAAIAGAVTLLGSGTAQAYPDLTVTLTVSDATLIGGKTFSFVADAGDVNCDWTVTYNGVASGVSSTQTGTGTSLSGSFKTKVVVSTFKSPIKAVCETTDVVNSSSSSVATTNTVTPAFYSTSSSSVVQAATTTASATAIITLLPEGEVADEDDDGSLPGTGGSNVWLLVLGGALVVAGGGITYATRRRHSGR